MTSNRFALLIGVSQYGEGLDALPGSLLDIAEMAKVLNDPDRGNFQVELLADPIRSEMEQKVEEFFDSGKRDDLLLFYFSGHGDLGKSVAHQQLHLCAKDTNKINKRLVETSAMSAEVLKREMNLSKSQQIVVILDCCYSGAIAELLRKGEGNIEFSGLVDSKDLKAPGRVILASSSSAELSYQAPDGLSLYTHNLIKGMQGAAESGQADWIVARDLHDYAVRLFEIPYAGATQPKIIVARDEGYNIPVVKAPKRDPKVEYRRAVEKLFEEFADENIEFDGEIQANSFERLCLDARQRAILGLSQEDAQQIEIDEKSPYLIRSRNRIKYREAVEMAYAIGFPFTKFTRRRLDEMHKDLSLREDIAKKIEKGVIERLEKPLLPEPPLPTVITSEESK